MAYNILKVFRRDADTSAVADGAVDQLSTNAVGRLKVSDWPGAYDTITGNITSATSTITADVTRAVSATIGIAGTYTGVTAEFEFTVDGTNWMSLYVQPITALSVSALQRNIVGYSSIVAGFNATPLLGITGLRVRATAYGTGTAVITIQRSSVATSVSSQVTGTVTATLASTTLTAVTPGTAATSLGKAEDAAHTSGDVGVEMLGVRNDTLADTTNANGDYTQVSTDIKGKLIVGMSPRTQKGKQSTTLTSTTTETTIVTAQGAGVFADVYALTITNTSATATEVIIRDVTAGGTPESFMAPAGQTVGWTLTESAASKQGTANSAWTATCVTSVASIKITAKWVNNL